MNAVNLPEYWRVQNVKSIVEIFIEGQDNRFFHPCFSSQKTRPGDVNEFNANDARRVRSGDNGRARQSHSGHVRSRRTVKKWENFTDGPMEMGKVCY